MFLPRRTWAGRMLPRQSQSASGSSLIIGATGCAGSGSLQPQFTQLSPLVKEFRHCGAVRSDERRKPEQFKSFLSRTIKGRRRRSRQLLRSGARYGRERRKCLSGAAQQLSGWQPDPAIERSRSRTSKDRQRRLSRLFPDSTMAHSNIPRCFSQLRPRVQARSPIRRNSQRRLPRLIPAPLRLLASVVRKRRNTRPKEAIPRPPTRAIPTPPALWAAVFSTLFFASKSTWPRT